MKVQFVATLMLLCVSQLTLGDDLAKEKEAALQKISEGGTRLYKAYKTTCDVFWRRPILLDPIKNRKMELGDSLLETSLFEVKKISEGAKQKARLISESTKFNDCIEAKKEGALDRLQKAFTEGFAKSLGDLYLKAFDRKKFLTDRWSDRYEDLFQRACALGNTARDEIKATNNKAYLADIVANYERFINEAVKVTLSLETLYKNNEINYDRTLDNGPVKAFRDFSRKVVDGYLDNVNNCYAVV